MIFAMLIFFSLCLIITGIIILWHERKITVYHGTSLYAWENIKQVGFEPNHTTGLNTNMFPKWGNEYTGLWVSNYIERANLHCHCLAIACGKMNTSPIILSWKMKRKDMKDRGIYDLGNIYATEYLISWDTAKEIDISKIKLIGVV